MSRRSSRRPVSFLGFLALLVVVGCRQLTQSPSTSNRPRPNNNSSGGSSRPSNSGYVPSGRSSNEGHLLLGNPSSAATKTDNYLLSKPQYSLSYNKRNGGPNWVAWHTDSSDFGDTDRGKFRPDPDLPTEWQITPNDYKNSGYDRGHMCPSADRTNSRANNDATFYMSNMVPQAPELNQHVWADLENYLRDQVRAGNEIYQITGPAGKAETIADGAVVVPKMCWKIAVILPEGTGDLRRINARTRVIAVAMPNTSDDRLKNADWRSYRTTPRKIEDATRLEFFSALPSNVRVILEQRTDSDN